MFILELQKKPMQLQPSSKASGNVFTQNEYAFFPPLSAQKDAKLNAPKKSSWQAAITSNREHNFMAGGEKGGYFLQAKHKRIHFLSHLDSKLVLQIDAINASECSAVAGSAHDFSYSDFCTSTPTVMLWQARQWEDIFWAFTPELQGWGERKDKKAILLYSAFITARKNCIT